MNACMQQGRALEIVT